MGINSKLVLWSRNFNSWTLRVERLILLGGISTNLDANEDIRLNESDYEESKDSADVVENIPINLDICVASDDAE
ncbi:hypothetical protein TNCV_1260831 [Trichonephila clavipes]|nr:hypothetical protein TNCV_1260831 [Trichonephila clavipes]